jgi:hypothetical protein
VADSVTTATIIAALIACTSLSNSSSADDLAMARYDDHYDGAHECHLKFNRAVLERIRPFWHRRRH